MRPVAAELLTGTELYRRVILEKLLGARFYEPSENGWEKTLKERLAAWRALKKPAPTGE